MINEEKKPDTTTYDCLDKTSMDEEFIFDIVTHKGQRNVLFLILILSLSASIGYTYVETSRLQKEIEYNEIDYKILLQICNEKG